MEDFSVWLKTNSHDGRYRDAAQASDEEAMAQYEAQYHKEMWDFLYKGEYVRFCEAMLPPEKKAQLVPAMKAIVEQGGLGMTLRQVREQLMRQFPDLDLNKRLWKVWIKATLLEIV